MCQVLLQQIAALGRGCVPFAAQPREDLHLPDGHMGFAQAQQEPDPFHVRRRITALTAGRSRDRSDQACALVVAQRVGGEARASGDFGNGEEGCHGNDSESWSAL